MLIVRARRPDTSRWLSMNGIVHTVLQSKPFGYLLRIETHRSPHMKTGKLTSRCHSIDMLIIDT